MLTTRSTLRKCIRYVANLPASRYASSSIQIASRQNHNEPQPKEESPFKLLIITEEEDEDEDEDKGARPLRTDCNRRANISNNNNTQTTPKFVTATTPRGFWSNTSNHKQFFEWAAQQLRIQNVPEDWYNISNEEIKKLGGGRLLDRYYNNSLFRALSSLYPEHEWLPWRFSRAPRGLWTTDCNNSTTTATTTSGSSTSNNNNNSSSTTIHRQFFDWAAKQLNLAQIPEDWYRVSREQVFDLGGTRLIQHHYAGSLFKALATVYPEHEWLPWRFQAVPTGFWRDRTNHRLFFDWIAKKLNVEKPEDWYNVSYEDVSNLGGAYVLDKYYNSSLCHAISTVYQQEKYEWLPWRFRRTPVGFWNDRANHRRFFDWCARQLNLSTDSIVDDWYRVSRDDIYAMGGAGLLDGFYDGSLFKALKAVYPEYEFHPWRFQHFVTSQALLSDESILKQYVEFLAKELGIGQTQQQQQQQQQQQSLEEWYRVSVDQIKRLGGGYSIIAHHGGLYPVLRKVYPEYNWDADRFASSASGGKGKRAMQRWLRVAAQKLLPHEEVFEDFHHPDLVYDETKSSMILDVWIPSLSLALEYHGEQHYHDYPLFGNPSKVQDRDARKAAACRQAGITLVAIPYWWNGSLEDLAASICQARPSLLAMTQATRQPAATVATSTATTDREEQHDESTTTSTTIMHDKFNLLCEAAVRGQPIYEQRANNTNKAPSHPIPSHLRWLREHKSKQRAGI